LAKLVIVESASKAKNIQQYLGSDYDVVACLGHVRDLPKSKLGVDIENNFKPSYVEMSDKKDIIKKLRQKAKDSDFVYLAADPDREGEAISWHLCHILGLNENDKNRITFNEVTKSCVKAGIAAPRTINMDLVDAQQARRVLDRIVGYKISPFLWKKIKRGLSAGRVQSVAVKILVDRENEIRNFTPEEYWSIDALFKKDSKSAKFDAHFYGGADGKKIEIKSEKAADKIIEDLNSASYVVSAVKKGTRKKTPTPPFTTSTMQQEASRKLGFNSERTMRIAQALYEGMNVEGYGTTGLITYMRTDSLRISEEARTQGNEFILSRYGKEYLPANPRYFKQKKKIQDGHEAVRPTIPSLTPELAKGSLTNDQYKLYKLIWERFIASLMSDCLQNTVSIDITAGDYIFKASGYTVKFDGFTVLYEEKNDDENEKEKALPNLKVGDNLILSSLKPNQHFTQPPPRYNEATLIKALEEYGIGRPSTYAPTISTIVKREYVEREKRTLVPTQLGEIVTNVLQDLFTEIVDTNFTAKIETQLDEVENGKRSWVKMMDDFYKGFEKTLKNAEVKMDGTRIKVPEQESDVICENCGRRMVIKSGRFGKFLACPGFPECKNTKPIVTEMPGSCPKCGSKILKRKSPKGRIYYGCEKGKECGFMTWDEPTAEICPKCGKSLFKRRGGILVCGNEECDFQKEAEPKTSKKNEN
jgi:DNA topoisomerase-1